MPGLGIDIDMDPTPFLLVAQFNALDVDVRSFREPLKRSIQKVIAPSIGKNFDLGGRPPWEPLGMDTVTHCRYDSSFDILRRTGRLKRVAQQLNVWQLGRDYANATDLPGAEYGFVHQTGGIGGQGADIPERPFLAVQDEDLNNIENVFEDWFAERLDRHGFRRGVI
jgi:phage gpG-like protein